jgi:outer membrane protein W
MKNTKKLALSLLLLSACFTTHGKKDVILEMKGAFFQPINCTFKNIYGGGAIFGPELTFNIFRNIHGFVSYDYFTKNGSSIGLSTPTSVNFMALGVGVKFMGCVSDHARLYAGLGFEPVYLTTKNCSSYVSPKTQKWGFGGIAKFGAYIDLPHSFVLDLFADYSFVKVSPSCCTGSPLGYIQPTKADLSGFIFGAGIGYRFN